MKVACHVCSPMVPIKWENGILFREYRQLTKVDWIELPVSSNE
jgi:hypothetical protein